MANKESVRNLGQSINSALGQILQALVTQRDEGRVRQSFSQFSEPSIVGGEKSKIDLRGGGQADLQKVGVETPDTLSVLGKMLQSDPTFAKSPAFQEMFKAEAMMQQLKPKPQVVPGGADVIDNKGNMIYSNPKQEKPTIPNFAQMTPGRQASEYNRVYGTNFTAEDFASEGNRLINTFNDENGKHIGVYQNTRTFEVFNEELGKVPKAGEAQRQKALDETLTLEDNLKEYEKALKSVEGGRVGGSLEKALALVEQRPIARAAGGFENALAGMIARRVFGEVGVLTEQDIERAKQMIPQITDNETERQVKFKMLRSIIESKKSRMSVGGGQTPQVDEKPFTILEVQ